MAGVTAIVAQDQFEPGSGKIESIAGSNMAPFLTKLFQIVSANTTDHCIQWTPKGDSFVISDPDTFARDILPTYFKHNNIRSFIRQLNTYGFRKRTNISSTDEHLEFFHEKFRRDQLSLLMQIKRCHQPKPQSRQAGPSAAEESMSMSMSMSMAMTDTKNGPDMDTIRSRVGELKARLGSLQSEIRDYNMQMEHKVNVLMQILQTSMPPQPAQQRQQGQEHEMQSSLAQARQPSLPQMPQQQSQPSAQTSSFAAQLGMPMGGMPLRQSGSVPAAGGAFNPSVDLLNRCDALFASLGEQSSGLSSGLTSGLSGMGGIAGLGLPGLGNAIGGIGGAGGLANGLMGGLGGLGGLSNVPKSGEVAGLQHLLEAAQRYREGGGEGKGEGDAGARVTQVAST